MGNGITKEIIQNSISGDQEAFRIIYEYSLPHLKAVAVKYLKNPHDADDALQETYIRIYEKLDSLESSENFLAWSKQVCRTVCLNMLAAQKHQIDGETVEETGTEGLLDLAVPEHKPEFNPEAAMDGKECKRLIDEMIGELPDTQRLCILLWRDQMTSKEIGEVLHISDTAVRFGVHKAKEKIKVKVLALEKQGTKLYGLAPIPFFLYILDLYDDLFAPELAEPEIALLFQQVSAGLPGCTEMTTAGNTLTESVSKVADAAKTRPRRMLLLKVLPGMALSQRYSIQQQAERLWRPVSVWWSE